MKGILGRKVGMTQVFSTDGVLVPVTVVEAGPCVVTQKKTVETDGYNSIQVGFGEIKEKKVNKPMKGHFDKAGVAAKKFLREFRLDDISAYELGQEITASVFAAGDFVDVSGTSKGKGYQGVIKRHGQSRVPMSHGAGPVHREVGSMGACSSPSRVFKGKKLAGQMGNERVTVQNLEIVKVMEDKNLILVKGAIPGPKGGLVTITNTVKSGK